MAWQPWQFFSDGNVEDALKLLDDDGTWWDMLTRADGPMTRMKALLAETMSMVPMHFEFVGSIVEGDRIALMVESFADLPNGVAYNNVYTFITTLDPVHDVIIGVREYVDTAHAFQTLAPAVMAATPGGSALGSLVGENAASRRESSTPPVERLCELGESISWTAPYRVRASASRDRRRLR